MARHNHKAERLRESNQWIVAAATFLGAALSFLPFGAGAADDQSLKEIQPLKIEYSHGSGVNPRHFERWECKLDTRSMKTDEAAKLAALVKSTSILSTRENEYSTTEGGPFYSINIEAPKAKRKFSWSYEHAPGSIRPLVKFLEEHSKRSIYENGKQVQ